MTFRPNIWRTVSRQATDRHNFIKEGQTMEDREVTVREATIFALDNSEKAFEEFRKCTREIGECFDTGRDEEAFAIIKETFYPGVIGLAQFCHSMLEMNHDVLGKELSERLCSDLAQINELLTSVAKETENGNFTEIGDVLRFDFIDVIASLSKSFPEIKEAFRTSTKPSLDEY